MVAIITCSRQVNEALNMFASFQKSLPNAILIEEVGHTSMAAGYNAGMAKALANPLVSYLFFTHSDVINLASTYAFEQMFKHMWSADAGPTPGWYGVAGASYLNSTGIWWNNPPEKLFGGITHEQGRNTYQFIFGQGSLNVEVLVLDGVFLACRRDALNAFKWTSKGFHFYDIDACLDFQANKQKNFVFNIPLLHKSIGTMTQEYEEARLAFLKNWSMPRSIKNA